MFVYMYKKRYHFFTYLHFKKGFQSCFHHLLRKVIPVVNDADEMLIFV